MAVECRWRVYCETEGTYTYLWSETVPTEECLNDSGHTHRVGSLACIAERPVNDDTVLGGGDIVMDDDGDVGLSLTLRAGNWGIFFVCDVAWRKNDRGGYFWLELNDVEIAGTRKRSVKKHKYGNNENQNYGHVLILAAPVLDATDGDVVKVAMEYIGNNGSVKITNSQMFAMPGG